MNVLTLALERVIVCASSACRKEVALKDGYTEISVEDEKKITVFIYHCRPDARCYLRSLETGSEPSFQEEK